MDNISNITHHIENTPEPSVQSQEPSREGGSLEGLSVTVAPSETTRLKKSVWWDQKITEWSLNLSEQFESPTVPSSMNATEDQHKKVLFLSRSIEKWAADIAEEKSNELQEVEAARAYVKKNPTAFPQEIKEKLEAYRPIILDQASKAKKYAIWTNWRTQLLQGNRNLQSALEEKGKSISRNWTLDHLQEDWKITKEEPWAQEDPQYEELKKVIAPLAAQHRQIQQELAEAKAKIRSFAKDVKQAEQKALQKKTKSDSTADKTIYTPIGSFDPREDFGTVEYDDDDDGSYTISDTEGRRFHYPINRSSSSENSSCIVS